MGCEQMKILQYRERRKLPPLNDGALLGGIGSIIGSKRLEERASAITKLAKEIVDKTGAYAQPIGQYKELLKVKLIEITNYVYKDEYMLDSDRNVIGSIFDKFLGSITDDARKAQLGQAEQLLATLQRTYAAQTPGTEEFKAAQEGRREPLRAELSTATNALEVLSLDDAAKQKVPLALNLQTQLNSARKLVETAARDAKFQKHTHRQAEYDDAYSERELEVSGMEEALRTIFSEYPAVQAALPLYTEIKRLNGELEQPASAPRTSLAKQMGRGQQSPGELLWKINDLRRTLGMPCYQNNLTLQS